ncbi:DUF4340 domain-containing protein [Bremerella sp. JC817]|uniref:DUF4340 domain-containing protein n=1 Tax=Bremerella sp. JC817 TaxID=3231756 RepID=UPI00345AE0F7
MSESLKTIIFVAIAAIIGGVAYVSRPAPVTSTPEEEVNQALFPEFTDPLQAESMKITRFDSDRGQLRQFEVTDTRDGWQIATKSGYPANATEHMSLAANSLVDLNVLRVVGDLPGQHAEFGVIEPNANSLSADSEGVGELITIKGKSDKTLANLIVGAADKEDPKLRYVRIPGRDRIYLVRLDPSVFSTEFSDWIDKDLLKLNPFDVGSLRFRNYTMQANPTGISVLPQMDATVGFNQDANAWQLFRLQDASPDDPSKLVGVQLPADQKLNREKLDEIRNALNDITIVDVFRKPDALADALKNNLPLEQVPQDDLRTLIANGFFPFTLPGETKAAMVGVNGELVIETVDAIRYRLLFGIDKLGGDNKDQKQQYLFVQTEFIDEMLPPPNLQEVPEIKEGEDQDVEAQAVAREKILQENEALMTAYREQKNEAMRKIFELNARFADWYYVVKAEDVDKILLKRDQLSVPLVQATTQPSGTPGREFPGIMSGNGMMRPSAQPATPPASTAKPMETNPATEEPAKEEPSTEKPADEKPAEEPKEEAPTKSEPMAKESEDKPADPEAATEKESTEAEGTEEKADSE